MPYMLYEPGNLGAQVGFIFGSVAVLALVFAFFFVPDCTGRTLEEIDKLFESGTPLRHFKKAQIQLSPSEMELSADNGASLKNTDSQDV